MPTLDREAQAVPRQMAANDYAHPEHDPGDEAWTALRAPSHEDLPQALIVTCECDPLRDEGKAYAERLQQAGVQVKHIQLPARSMACCKWAAISVQRGR